MREELIIKRVSALISEYTFDEPFSTYIKHYFRKYPVMGSRDRRETREWTYNLLRMGHNLRNCPLETRICVACFLCGNGSYPALEYLFKKYSVLEIEKISLPVSEKLSIVRSIYPEFKIELIFPMHQLVSPLIEKEKLFMSLIRKQKVWIRIRKSKISEVEEELKTLKIAFEKNTDPTILEFAPEVALEKTKSWEKGFFEIQDISSQRTKHFFKPHAGEDWWDACSGSGGKSLLLIDEEPDINLFATDNRMNILEKYSDRLKRSGFKSFKKLQIDLSASPLRTQTLFDGVIADVPCSGSGTWGRSPEFLKKDVSREINEYYVPLQRKIVNNCLLSLKPNKPLIYITCSIFSEENEENIRYFADNLPIKIEKFAYIEGFDFGADTLFAARIIKEG